MQRAHTLYNVAADGLRKGSDATLVLPSGRQLAIAFKKHGVSERAAAERLGMGSTEVHRWLGGERAVNLDRLMAAMPQVALTFLELAAAALSASLAESQRRVNVSTRHLSIAANVGDAARETRDALADGRIDAAEAQRISVACLRAADELRQTAAQVAEIAAAGREGER